MDENDAYELISVELNRALARLSKKDICPCCVARMMMHGGAELLEAVADAKAVLMTCKDIIDDVVPQTQH